MAGLWPPLAESHHDGPYETLCFNSHNTLKIKGRVCVAGNEDEIRMGRLVNWDSGLGYVKNTQIMRKGRDKHALYTES